ncbi:hypothetical protein ACFQQB_70880 [Nonomuraea rubra]|uniref:hypothetical protein n=1 Tax=Nonomuraea rubra TaxID=46180 RepID=UPI00361CFAB0
MTERPLVVIGDTLLDVDVEGEAERLCPDAPVPVLDVSAEQARPGGAGLAALLAARDGAEVVLITAIGDDPDGHRLCGLLSQELDLVRPRCAAAPYARPGSGRAARRSSGWTPVTARPGTPPPRRRSRRSAGPAPCWSPTTAGAWPGWPASCCARWAYRWCGTPTPGASSRCPAARC